MPYRHLPATFQMLSRRLTDSFLRHLNAFQTPFRLIPDIFQTPSRCLQGAFQTPSKCLPLPPPPESLQKLSDARQWPSRHFQDPLQKFLRHLHDPFQISLRPLPYNITKLTRRSPDTFQKPSRHFQTQFRHFQPSRHLLDTYTFHTNFWPFGNPQWLKSNSDLAG